MEKEQKQEVRSSSISESTTETKSVKFSGPGVSPEEQQEASSSYLKALLLVSGFQLVFSIFDHHQYLNQKINFLDEIVSELFNFPYGSLVTSLPVQIVILVLLWRQIKFGIKLAAFFSSLNLVFYLILIGFSATKNNILFSLEDLFITEFLHTCLSSLLPISIIWLIIRPELLAIFRSTRRQIMISIGIGIALNILFVLYSL